VPERITGADERNVDYVWMYDNVRGVAVERWFHEAGCRRWHTARRDTSTDRFVSE
jgi:heterotetrameric sarcosine oxidase delta subunit